MVDMRFIGLNVGRRASIFAEGSLEVKHPTIWTDGKAEVGRVREKIREERAKTKGVQARAKVEKSRFQWFVIYASGGKYGR